MLHIQYMFMYLVSLHELLWHNTIEYFYGHFLTLIICTEWNQPELHILDSKSWYPASHRVLSMGQIELF